jgi:hypothetical protein
VSTELSETNGDVLVSYYLTSIYDHSALEAFSKVTLLDVFVLFFCVTYLIVTARLSRPYSSLRILKLQTSSTTLQVVQKLVPQLPTLNNLLDILIARYCSETV